jgi:hypothetical protein
VLVLDRFWQEWTFCIFPQYYIQKVANIGVQYRSIIDETGLGTWAQYWAPNIEPTLVGTFHPIKVQSS